MTHSLSSWIVKTGDGAGLNALVPTTVYAGGTATVGLSWSGLTSGKRYVGGVQFQDAGGVTQATTTLRSSTDGSELDQVTCDSLSVATAGFELVSSSAAGPVLLSL